MIVHLQKKCLITMQYINKVSELKALRNWYLLI